MAWAASCPGSRSSSSSSSPAEAPRLAARRGDRPAVLVVGPDAALVVEHEDVEATSGHLLVRRGDHLPVEGRRAVMAGLVPCGPEAVRLRLHEALVGPGHAGGDFTVAT